MAETIAELREQRKKLDERIAALEAEGDDEPLTPARVRREFTPEQATRELARQLERNRIASGYGDPREKREGRQEGRGPRGGLYGEGVRSA